MQQQQTMQKCCKEALLSTVFVHISGWNAAARLATISAFADTVHELCPSPSPEKQGLQQSDELWHQLAACIVEYFAELLICHAEQGARGS